MRISSDSWLLRKPVAHRGLWGDGVMENSLTAYRLAAEKGFPIEIDLYFTKDKHIVSFHDDTVTRMTGKDGFVWDYDLKDLKKLRLGGTDEQIPTFDEVLSVCEGKSPLLIEIKNQPIKGLPEAVLERLKTYRGEYAIQSFNPLYINVVRKLAPDVTRGILSGINGLEGMPWYKRLIVRKMLLNFLIKPDFISYEKVGYPLKKSKTKGKALLAWTVTSPAEAKDLFKKVNNIIYEGFDIETSL